MTQPENRSRIRSTSALVVCFTLLAGAGPLAAAEGEEPWSIRPANGTLLLDGRLDEFAWQDALEVTLDYVIWPQDNAPSPVKTEVKLTYDESNLYIGFRAYDPRPSEIRARYADHDKCWRDDLVGVALDTFNVGDHIDFANTRPGERVRLQPSMRYFVGRHLQIALAHTYEQMMVAAGELYTANITRLSAAYQITPRSRLKMVIDGVDYRYNVANYRESRHPRDRGLATQVLFSYRINPQTSLFAGYNDSYQGDHELGLTQSDRTVFLKVGYAWAL